MEDQNYFHFETEYTKYLTEQFAELWDNVLKVQELLSVIDNSHLVKAIKKLSEREQKVLFSRVFKQSSYGDIGKDIGVTEKKAEAIYHYAITKLRKDLEEK